LTLRFPRAVRIREELQPEDAATASGDEHKIEIVAGLNDLAEIFEHIASGKKRKQEEEAG
jgi:hypothetical protein